MATKFYFHATTTGLPSGTLPSDEQSTLTPDANDFEGSRTTNRLMNKTVGAAQANLTNTSTADSNAHNYYCTRFVSPKLAQTSVAANTWTMEYGAKESNAAANFPRNGAGAMYVCAYVWKPSNGTKYGNIIDGNTNTDGEEAGTSQSVINFTFSGSAVNSLTSGDAVIVVEIWFQVTQGTGVARTQDFYYDGTTENSTSNEAAFLSTPETLAFLTERSISETITFSPAVAEAATKFRSMSETITFSPAITRTLIKLIAISQSISFSDSVSRLKTAIRSVSNTIGFTDAIVRLKTANRSISQNISFSDSINRLKTAIRDISQSITFSDALARLFIPGAGGQLFERAINETISFADSLTRLATKNRAISETISFVDSLSKSALKLIAISQSISFSDSVSKVATKFRSISDNISFSDSVNRSALKLRSISQNISFTDSVTKVALLLRSINQNISFTDSINKSALKIRSIIENISFTDAVVRILNGAGNLFEVTINETIGFRDSVSVLLNIAYKIGGKPSGHMWKKMFDKRRKQWNPPNWKKSMKKYSPDWRKMLKKRTGYE